MATNYRLYLQLSYFTRLGGLHGNHNLHVDHILFLSCRSNFSFYQGGEVKKTKKHKEQINVSKTRQITLNTVAVSGGFYSPTSLQVSTIFFFVTSAKPLF